MSSYHGVVLHKHADRIGVARYVAIVIGFRCRTTRTPTRGALTGATGATAAAAAGAAAAWSRTGNPGIRLRL